MHLHVVCNDTCEHGLNLLVPISSFFDGCDTTCELQAGDHEFVTHLSYVFYAKCKLYQSSQLDRGIERQLVLPKHDIDDGIFVRIERGICSSPDTPLKVKQYFGCF